MTKFLLHIPLLVGLLLVPARGQADYQAGIDAYLRGDYETALAEFRPLAEQGHASAQYNLGVMFDNGLGVPQDYREAAKWYRFAAEQGKVKAQSNLASMYHFGQGVLQDDVLAHKWADLAASQGGEDAVKIRDAVARSMTPQQIAVAQRLAREWKPKGK